MSENEVIHESETGGKKAGNLQRASLVPPKPFLDLAKHFGVGSQKYDDHNWLKGYRWSLSFDALMRHAWAFWNGEDIDPETGTKHIIAVAWHAFVLAEFMDRYPQFDDRPARFLEELADKTPKPPQVLKCYPKDAVVDRLTPLERAYDWVDTQDAWPNLQYSWRNDRWEFRHDDSEEWSVSVTEDDGVTVPVTEGPFKRL